MFTELLESRGRRERRAVVGVASACAHAALIVAAAVATSRADTPPPRRPLADTTLVYHPRPERAAPPGAPRAASPGATRTPETTLPRPPVARIIDALPGIPRPDVPLGGMERALGSGPQSPANGPAGAGSGAVAPGGVYVGDAYVEKPALAAPGSPQPRYPELLRQAGVGGEVVAEFVVDTLGRVEPGTLRVVRSDHALFAAAVRAVLPSLRFLPAEAAGRRVRQLVRQPFSFAIR